MSENDLREALQEAKATIQEMGAFIEAVTQPPHWYGRVLRTDEDKQQVDVAFGKERQVVNCDPKLIKELKRGEAVTLCQIKGVPAVIAKKENPLSDGIYTNVVRILEGNRIVVDLQHVETVVDAPGIKAREGDSVIVDPSGSLILEHRKNENDYELAKVPEMPWEKVGGLAQAKADIRETLELPLKHPTEYKKYGIKAPKGVLLHGPPGCGKTLIAKAIAYNLNKNSAFYHVKGPELLDKWVGNSEKMIRSLFSKSRNKAIESGYTTILFVDEAEALLKRRGMSVSSDIGDTIVPQFLSEMDGMDDSNNILVIIASNRAETIDEAVLRPGRIDSKIYIGRPEKSSAKEIFKIYFKDAPLQEKLDSFVTRAVEETYDPELKLFKVNFHGASESYLPLSTIASGSLIENIANRAKTAAFKREIARKGKEGISFEDLTVAIEKEVEENRILTNLVMKEDLEARFGDDAKSIRLPLVPYRE